MLCDDCTVERCSDREKYRIVYCTDYKTEPKQSNADHIRAMSDEELCEFLYSYKFCDMCEEGCNECRYNGDCKHRLAEWLKQPAESDNGGD